MYLLCLTNTSNWISILVILKTFYNFFSMLHRIVFGTWNMANRFWKLEENSIFRTDVKCIKIIYHSNLNIILVLTKNGEILVIDVTSGVELHKSILSGNYIHYICVIEPVFSWNDGNVARI